MVKFEQRLSGEKNEYTGFRVFTHRGASKNESRGQARGGGPGWELKNRREGRKETVTTTRGE